MNANSRKLTNHKLKIRVLSIFIIIGLVIAGAEILQSAAAQSANFIETKNSRFIRAVVNDAPIIDLNGSDPNHNFTTTFTENEGPRIIVSNTMTITDSDSALLKSASVLLTNRLDGALEYLEISTEDTEISASYNTQTGNLQLYNSDTIANYQKALSTVSYNNLSESPTNVDRLITFELFDGENYSNQAVSTVLVEAINDAPILHNSFRFSLSAISEDDTNQFGNRVAALIDPAETGGEDRITDPDKSNLEGVAVIGADSSNGYWQFSIDAGLSWQNFGPLSNRAATLLDPSARIRFLPNLNYHGTSNVTIRAWDQTSGANGGMNIDVSENGGTTAFSQETAIVSLEILAINDPPISDVNGIAPGTDLAIYYLLGSGPVPIAAPQGAIKDVDNEQLTSATVTLQTRPDGTDEFLQIETASQLITIGPYNPKNGELRLSGAASLAEYNTLLQSIRYDNISETPTLADRIIEITANDGLNDGLTSTTTLRLITSNNAPQLVNDEPLLLDAVIEDEEAPSGNSVAEIIASIEPEPVSDDEGALRGFAIVDATQDDGQWQFSIDGGVSWHIVGNVSNTSAVLVNSEALLRFLPDKDAGGFSRELTVRAWDQTSGANGSRNVDVSQYGGSTAFSAESTQVLVDVVAVNDPPMIRLAEGITAVFTEDNGPVNVVGPSLELVDVDNEKLISATVSITNHRANDGDLLLAAPNGSGISTSFSPETGTLFLSGTAPVAAYQAVLRAVSFDNPSHDPAVYDRFISFQVSDGLGASNNVSSTIKIESINDRPVVDLNGLDTPGSNGSVIFNQSAWGGNAIPISGNLELQDLDDSSLVGATVTLVERPDGHNEYLAVRTEGTNIVSHYEPEKGQLQLSGVSSLLEYERVLRTITYTNTQQRPRTVNRRVRFSVRDQEETSDYAISQIIVTPKLVMLPMLINSGSVVPETDEPNNSCQEAHPIIINAPYQFFAEDKDDWYIFTLDYLADVVVKLTNYEPVDGQILTIRGQCDALELIGHNGDFSTEKSIRMDKLLPGKYYIWLITDNLRTSGDPFTYDLMVEVNYN